MQLDKESRWDHTRSKKLVSIWNVEYVLRSRKHLAYNFTWHRISQNEVRRRTLKITLSVLQLSIVEHQPQRCYLLFIHWLRGTAQNNTGMGWHCKYCTIGRVSFTTRLLNNKTRCNIATETIWCEVGNVKYQVRVAFAQVVKCPTLHKSHKVLPLYWATSYYATNIVRPRRFSTFMQHLFAEWVCATYMPESHNAAQSFPAQRLPTCILLDMLYKHYFVQPRCLWWFVLHPFWCERLWDIRGPHTLHNDNRHKRFLPPFY